MIYVLDYGSQYSHLITRRIRELGVYAELVPHNIPLLKLQTAEGIILSGGPQNLSKSRSLRIDRKVFELGLPILGICYGMQLTAYELGGRVKAGKNREYGPTEIKIVKKSPLFLGLSPKQMTWMSHGDQVVKLPKGFVSLASSQNCSCVAIANEKKKIYGLQFHAEVIHTKNGKRILENFLKIAKAKRNWSMKDFVTKEVAKIKNLVGDRRAICALSGGIDSIVAATMVEKAIGVKLTCIFVDTGLMREIDLFDIKKLKSRFRLKIVKAQNEFLTALHGVTDPEKKRKIIGHLFIKVFKQEAHRLKKISFLVQGTLYTDAVTSGVSIGKSASVIKSHHNVGGLPKHLGFTLIEPLRELYKDEVRQIGRNIGLPETLTERQPFPGPGLAVRIIGEVTKDKLAMLRKADEIVRKEISQSKQTVEQYFAVLPDVKSVGVQGDARTYGYPIIVRAITTKDFMTAHWAKLPHSVLETISTRITNEIPGINRVVYDITSKPPGTVEWE